ncbi:MAG: triose-phosphate isomerase [Bacteroidetes bacterium]|nr:triose-phosphate isomerase [Bacteroidota bacterium]
MRKKIIAGNWKMNTVKEEAESLLKSISAQTATSNLSENKIVVVATPFPFIPFCVDTFSGFSHIYSAAQNCSEHEQGAYTGEVSAKMLASLNVQYVILGHSERRQYYNESDALILQKIKQAQSQQLIPIFCCGESLEIREKQQHFDFIKTQLEQCIFQLSEDEIKNLVIAYEPIWAIGTGKTATPEQAQEIHAFIRNELTKKYNETLAQEISILYGGSVNAKNAQELFACDDIDGGLVGGASLKADEFINIINAMS